MVPPWKRHTLSDFLFDYFPMPIHLLLSQNRLYLFVITWVRDPLRKHPLCSISSFPLALFNLDQNNWVHPFSILSKGKISPNSVFFGKALVFPCSRFPEGWSCKHYQHLQWKTRELNKPLRNTAKSESRLAMASFPFHALFASVYESCGKVHTASRNAWFLHLCG